MSAAGPGPCRLDPFAILGIPPRFAQDEQALQRLYHKLAREVHPDRFATADAATRREAASRSVDLNEAFRIVRDPFRRAECLLAARGIDLSSETGQAGSERVPAAPQALLLEMMELREALAEAQSRGDEAALARTRALARARIAHGIARAGQMLDAGDAPETIARELVVVRYWQRLLTELEGDA